jgi:hypothetical protein
MVLIIFEFFYEISIEPKKIAEKSDFFPTCDDTLICRQQCDFSNWKKTSYFYSHLLNMLPVAFQPLLVS